MLKKHWKPVPINSFCFSKQFHFTSIAQKQFHLERCFSSGLLVSLVYPSRHKNEAARWAPIAFFLYLNFNNPRYMGYVRPCRKGVIYFTLLITSNSSHKAINMENPANIFKQKWFQGWISRVIGMEWDGILCRKIMVKVDVYGCFQK